VCIKECEGKVLCICCIKSIECAWDREREREWEREREREREWERERSMASFRLSNYPSIFSV